MAFTPNIDELMGGSYANDFSSGAGFSESKRSDELAGQVDASPSLRDMMNDTFGIDINKKPGQASSNKQVLMYPQGLGTVPEYMNFVSFEIFESGGESISSNKESFLSSIGGSNQSVTTGLGDISSSISTKLSGIGGALNGISPGITDKLGSLGNSASLFSGLLNNTSSSLPLGSGLSMITSGMGKGIVSNLANSQGIGKLNNDAGIGWTQEKTGLTIANKKIDKTIYLYLPGSINLAYSQSYNDSENMAGTQGIADIAKTTGNSVKSILEGTSDVGLDQLGSELAQVMARGLSPKVSEVASKATESLGLEKVNLKQYYEAQTRQVPNPMILSLFQNTSRRTFTLGYEFYPTSEREMEEVYAIIETFKKYSHPKRSSDAGRMLDYPAEFKLTFYYGPNENRYIPRLARCALTKVQLNYGEKPFSTFRPNSKGAAPTKIKMDLDFTELNILTQEEIDRGY